MNNNEQIANVVPVFEQDSGRVSRTLVVGVAAAALVGSIIYVGTHRDSDSSHRRTTATGNAGDKACGNLEFAGAAADSGKYVSEAFLPKGDVSTADEVSDNVRGLFDADGPLGGKSDKASLALFNAVITEPAQDHKVFDPKRSITESFDRKVSAYDGPSSIKLAQQDCEVSYKVAIQTGELNSHWADKNEAVIKYVAVRGANNAITGLTLKNVGTHEVLSGIEYKVRDTTKDFDGFGSYLQDADGNLFSKGSIKEEAQKQSKAVVKQPIKPFVGKVQPSESSANGPSNNGSSNGSNSNSGSRNGSSTGNNHNSGGSAGGGVAPGKQPEKNPTGPNSGPGTGPSPEASNGTDNTPNGGNSAPPSSGNSPSSAPSPDNSPQPQPQPSSPAPQPSPRETTPPPQPQPSSPPPQPSSPPPSPQKSGTPCDPNIENCPK